VAAQKILPRDFLLSALVVLKKRVSLGLFDGASVAHVAATPDV
jgi:hypothetical protein